MGGSALMGLWQDVPADLEKDFNTWYDGEHFAERLSMPGFLSGRRYVSLRGDQKYVTLYDLQDLGALSSDAYQKARANPSDETKRMQQGVTANIRREYEHVMTIGSTDAAPYLLMVRLETAPEHDDEINRWYDEEHLAALAGVPGVLGARRYRALNNGSPKYLAVYELSAPDLREDDAWHNAADTPWTLHMRELFTKREDNLGQLVKKAP